MPNYSTNSLHFEPDDKPYPILGIATDIFNHQDPIHQHVKGQLLYGISGSMQAIAQNSMTLLIPNKALWLPAKIPHKITTQGLLKYRSLYFDLDHFPNAPKHISLITVKPLLREMINELCFIEEKNLTYAVTLRLAQSCMDQIISAAPLSYSLPLSSHKLISKAISHIKSNSHVILNSDAIAHYVGTSSRHLNRLFKKELGLTCHQWQQQLKIIQALELLTTTQSVAITADRLGFSSSSAFNVMFKRLIGKVPSDYIGV
ncbi:AraC family transcriptional regulator [Piscirickettsia salmonis]|uniref:AraC family transcriptional regulator n=1 Tax=Piscirickettsia salmonis TaxID=1238 RepID=UPI003EB90FA5